MISLWQIHLEEGEPHQGCACPANDAFKCWRVRYGIPAGETVTKSGGPCTCDCHEHDEEECGTVSATDPGAPQHPLD